MNIPVSYLPRVWAGSQLSPKLLPSRVRPLSAHVKLTENCQARCVSCDYWKTRWKDGIDTDRAVALIDEIDSLGIGSLRFTGGEPLIRKDFFEILSRSRARNFTKIIIQTNGLLIQRFHEQINDSPITNVNVSIDGMRESNDRIRGVQGYFDRALEGIRLLRNKKIAFSVTLNGVSARELEDLAQVARSVGAEIGFNILSRNLYFLQNGDIDSLWPDPSSVGVIDRFLRKTVHRPDYEADYIRSYYSHENLQEPACVLGYLTGLRSLQRRRADRLLSTAAGGQHPEDQPARDPRVRSVHAPGRSHDPPRMPGLHVWYRILARHEESSAQCFL